MPQATDLVLKNAAAVNKTFALAAPASGSSSALWYLREGANQGIFPKVEISARKNGDADARKVQITLSVPFPVTSTSGAVTRGAAMSFNIDATVPDLVPDATRDDAIAFVGALLADTLVKASLKVGFAPT